MQYITQQHLKIEIKLVANLHFIFEIPIQHQTNSVYLSSYCVTILILVMFMKQNIKTNSVLDLSEVAVRKCSSKFCNIHRKTLVLQSLFNEVAGLKSCNFIKKTLQQRCFPVNIAKFLRTANSIEHLWTASDLSSYQSIS